MEAVSAVKTCPATTRAEDMSHHRSRPTVPSCAPGEVGQVGWPSSAP